MAKQYDKIIKENLQELIVPLIRKTLQIEAVAYEVLPDKLEHTLEREADFVQRITASGSPQSTLFRRMVSSGFEASVSSQWPRSLRTKRSLLTLNKKLSIGIDTQNISLLPLK